MVVGGLFLGDEESKWYRCCPEGHPDSPQCSTCVEVPKGSHPVCDQGVDTSGC